MHELRLKGQSRLLERYGVENAFQLPHAVVNAKIGHAAYYQGYDSIEARKRAWEERFSVDVLEISDRDSQYVKFQCRSCKTLDVKTFYALTHRQRMVGNVCASCTGFTGGSLEQAQLYEAVKALAPDAIQNDRSVISPYELDIFVPSKKLAIEYHGIFWHSSEDELAPRYAHKLKLDRCRELGIRLIQVTSLNDKVKVLSLIRHALGLSERIGARRCKVEELELKNAQAKLELWHLNGAQASSKAYGLAHEGEVVLVATFSKQRYGKGSAHELVRLAVKPGVAVIGGISKLLTYVRKQLGPLITYSDNFLGGDGYEKAGLKLLGETPPNYWYVNLKTEQVLSRLAAQKHKLQRLLGDSYDPSLTEKQNMLSAGWRIFYDAGSRKYGLY